MIPVVVLASGRGTNFDAIHSAIERGHLDAEIVGVISDRPDALVLSKADQLKIPAVYVPVPQSAQGRSPLERRKQHELALMNHLETFKPRFLVMAGYMRIISPLILEA